MLVKFVKNIVLTFQMKMVIKINIVLFVLKKKDVINYEIFVKIVKN